MKKKVSRFIRKKTKKQLNNQKEREVLKMLIIKAIFIFFAMIYALSKMVDGMNNKYTNNVDRIVNLVEIVVSIAIVFVLFKI